MGRHEIASSPWRSPAVVIGVPVATVLATWSTTALIGGVVPSAEEAPLRAEEPSSAALVPGAVPAAPAGTTALPGGPGAEGPQVIDLADRVLPDPQEPSTSTLRVVRVADDVPAPSAAPRAAAERSTGAGAEGVRLVRLAERPLPGQRVSDRVGTDAVRDTVEPAPAAAASAPAVRDAVSEPAARAAAPVSSASSSGLAAPARSARTASVEEEEPADDGGSERRDAVLDLDTPSGGLSVLSFG